MKEMKLTAIAVTALTLLFAGCSSAPSKADRAATAQANASIGSSGYGVDEAVQTLALPPSGPLKPKPEFAHFPLYVGTLGGKQIEMRLGAKTGDPDDHSGVHGEYRFAGSASVILVAGDRSGDTLEIEESNDGTHITGNWVGKFAADGSVSGERMDPDDSNQQPFDLKPAVAGVTVPAAAAHAPSAPSARPAPPPAPSLEPAPPAPPPGSSAAPAPGHALGGVGNVSVGE
jgi:hypothetical protein